MEDQAYTLDDVDFPNELLASSVIWIQISISMRSESSGFDIFTFNFHVKFTEGFTS